MKTKICYICKTEKGENDFAKCSRHKDGLQGMCKLCSAERNKKMKREISEYGKKYYKENIEHMKENQIKRYRVLKTTEPWIMAYRAIKQRANEKNIDFDLDDQYIKNMWVDVCPVLGIPLYCAKFESGLTRNTSKARPMDNSPTIDRIDSNKGYVRGNVCVMSYRANMIKNCGTIDEHRKIVEFFEKQSS